MMEYYTAVKTNEDALTDVEQSLIYIVKNKLKHISELKA